MFTNLWFLLNCSNNYQSSPCSGCSSVEHSLCCCWAKHCWGAQIKQTVDNKYICVHIKNTKYRKQRKRRRLLSFSYGS